MRNDHVEPHRCGPDGTPHRALFDAVLFDRDGTLVHDVPYNGDPQRVRPVAGARTALDLLRFAGLRLGVVTNQSGLAMGRFTHADLARVNARIEELLGVFDTWQVCPHPAPSAGPPQCRCRKPAPGMIYDAARALGTVPARCVLIGDIGVDMVAAMAAGATGILVPTEATRPEEIAAAPAVARDLRAAVDLVLRRQGLVTPSHHRVHAAGVGSGHPAGVGGGGPAGAGGPPVGSDRRAGTRTGGRHVLVARPDSAGDVLVTGPAIRAVAAGADRVVMLCGPRGRAAAELLPGVDELIEWALPWIDPHPAGVDRDEVQRFVDRLAGLGVTEAIIFTSFHQSPLPLALLLRMAGVRRISAISDDYPGSLLDVRHRVPVGIPETERALSLAAAAGYPLPAGEQPVLRLRPEALLAQPVAHELPADGYVVVHPGASVPARACPPELCRAIVAALAEAGYRVVVTGGPDEDRLTAWVAGRSGVALGGRTSLSGLAAIIARARCLVVGNTGPAHLAAALGVPVVSLFAPTVPFGQWGPYRVPTVRLGDPTAACRHTRATVCPVPGHPCLSTLDPADVVAAVKLLHPSRAPVRSSAPPARQTAGSARIQPAGASTHTGPTDAAGLSGPAHAFGAVAIDRPAVLVAGKEGRT